MQMLRRRNPSRRAGSVPLRSSLADAAWALEDRVVWGTADILRAAGEALRWPIERLVWALENWLVWPIQEETAGWSGPARAGAGLATLLVAGAAVAAGIAVSNPSDAGRSATEAPPPAVQTTASPAPAPKPAAPHAPSLHGAAPTFDAKIAGGAKAGGRAGESEAPAAASRGEAATEGEASTSAGKAEAAAAAPRFSGREATAVARDFSRAFVLYETGRTTSDVKAAFSKTATPALAHALLKRPPRLPADVKVPEAKVLNVVAGPLHGDTYTVSVSLLRVGVTSELRLDVSAGKDGEPLVSDVRG
jgi:hypothetical protein